MKIGKTAHLAKMAARRARQLMRVPTYARRWGKWSGEKLREIRARNGVGRPAPRVYLEALPMSYGTSPAALALPKVAKLEKTPGLGTTQDYAHAYNAAVKEFGSQRKAADALGISLGRLQRVIAKGSR